MNQILLSFTIPVVMIIFPQPALILEQYQGNFSKQIHFNKQINLTENKKKNNSKSKNQIIQSSGDDIEQQNQNKLRFEQIIQTVINNDLSSLTMGEVLQEVSRQFLGAVYQAGLLDKSEQEKLFISLKQFDCVLFVETVLGISRNIAAQDYQYETFVNNIQNVRYANGEINDYCSRLHYFSDWINDNEKRGNVQNITDELGGVKFAKKLNFMTTNRKLYPKLVNNEANYQCILQREKQLNQLDIYYIPHSQIKAIYEKLQPGDIIAIATDISGLDVTHTGLVYRTKEENIGFIHASPAGQVTIAQDLQTYAQNVKNAAGIIVARPLNKTFSQ
ncbi:MAG TPA: DUF1460 domain-containing protein [Cyanothece sp. UBA12306]|nr:DUF1460 domain-containing protein [Cyanothece sp. UBA12306]